MLDVCIAMQQLMNIECHIYIISCRISQSNLGTHGDTVYKRGRSIQDVNLSQAMVQPTTGHQTWLGNPWKSSINGHCNGKIMENQPTTWFFFQQTMAMSFPWNLLVMRFSMESTYNPPKTNRVEEFHGVSHVFAMLVHKSPCFLHGLYWKSLSSEAGGIHPVERIKLACDFILW